MTQSQPRVRRRRTFVLEALESRLLMSAAPSESPLLAFDPAVPAVAAPAYLAAAESVPTAAASLASVPALSSHPAAAAKLYLDFDGAAAQTWGAYSVPATPAYDQDGDATTFSTGELASIQTIWARVAEAYSPFQLDVTTVDPGNRTNLQTLQVVFGGDGSWIGPYGGVSYVDSFSNAYANTVWVFTKNLSNGSPKYSADAGIHEAGHGFGLDHQSSYDASGVKTAEYNKGDSQKAPIMGVAYTAARGLWWYGTSTFGASVYQDDLAILTNGHNGFGFRADDHGDTLAAATPLDVSGNSVSRSGIIASNGDQDVFSFATDAGTINLTGSVATAGPMLDLKLSLYSDAGVLVASADTASLGETMTATVPAGSYRLVVASEGGYGDIGQYTVSGTVLTPADFVAAPSNLTATTVSATQVNLAWQDNSGNEDGFRIERSSDGGATWGQLADVAANVTAASDLAANSALSYMYRVSAYRGEAVSEYSNVAVTEAVVVPPSAPASASAQAVSASDIDVSWSNVNGETSYKIERSTSSNRGWAVVASTSADVTTYRDTGLKAATTYYYRISAVNSAGTSATSPVASATTQKAPAPSIPVAPTSLTIAGVSKSSVTLSWTDKSGDETGFKIERSTNGSKWTQVATVGANVTSYVNSGLKANTTYYFRVRSYNTAGNSAYSNTVSTKTASAALPSEPVARGASLTDSAPVIGSVGLAGVAASGAANGFVAPQAVDRVDLAAVVRGFATGTDLDELLAGNSIAATDLVFGSARLLD